MKFAAFDEQMRRYEKSLDQSLPPGIWPVVRVEGRFFTRLTEMLDLEKSFDERFRDAMVTTTTQLMQCGLRLLYAYVAGDEISVLFAGSDDSFQRKIPKWISIIAGEASAAFTHAIKVPGVFDARLCPLPDIEAIVDYFRWRQDDCQRNALIELSCLFLGYQLTNNSSFYFQKYLYF